MVLGEQDQLAPSLFAYIPWLAWVHSSEWRWSARSYFPFGTPVNPIALVKCCAFSYARTSREAPFVIVHHLKATAIRLDRTRVSGPRQFVNISQIVFCLSVRPHVPSPEEIGCQCANTGRHNMEAELQKHLGT